MVFGAQDTNEVYFDELCNLYEIYKSYVGRLITHISKEMPNPLAIKAETDRFPYYTYGLGIIS
jgi:fatty acid synthase subunit alpha, fungi type